MPNFPRYKVVAEFSSKEEAERFKTALEALMNNFLAYERGVLIVPPKLQIEEDREL